ncbi:hypothetical protein [Alkalispirochaeta sphaeroplastigenens]|uniref:hypothetical protein n=1 Tax=Alkalispirochaeta sphaeroplastigenens TaxID=1187066 RepID=UPI0011AF23F4|nr:hypothetical protein [Alkalispirochaeta sphaeroplastigenens]
MSSSWKKYKKSYRNLFVSHASAIPRDCVDDYYSSLSVATDLYQKRYNEKNIVSPILRAFRKNKVRANLLSDSWWMAFLRASTCRDPESFLYQGYLIDFVKNNKCFENLRHDELIHIASLALRTGLLLVAYELRSKALESALKYRIEGSSADPIKVRAKLAALLEKSEKNEFARCIEKINEKFFEEKEIFSHLNSILHDKAVELFEANDKSFFENVQNKSVAIVGPAKTDQNDAFHIDQSDFVVRCNYRSSGVGVDPVHKGLRCDASYFNGEQARFIYESPRLDDWPDEIRWIVCKGEKKLEKMVSRLKIHFKECGTEDIFLPLDRYLKRVEKGLFSGSLNAIPNIVLDILRFCPSEVIIFHADLMLSIGRLKGYYPDAWERDKDEKMKSSFLKGIAREHDPLTQYWILNRLWCAGRLKGDSRFNEVMGLGQKEYMRQLQQIYGDFGRILID